jgi:hypothetical protein
MNIPKKLHLLGHEITVEYCNSLLHEEDKQGQARFRENKILILPSTPDYPRIRSDIEVTFCHELIHWVLMFLGRDDLNSDELFVSQFSQLLHQALKTSEGELK